MISGILKGEFPSETKNMTLTLHRRTPFSSIFCFLVPLSVCMFVFAHYQGKSEAIIARNCSSGMYHFFSLEHWFTRIVWGPFFFISSMKHMYVPKILVGGLPNNVKKNTGNYLFFEMLLAMRYWSNRSA